MHWAERLADELIAENPGKEEFYVSAYPKEFVTNAKLFYEVKKEPLIS